MAIAGVGIGPSFSIFTIVVQNAVDRPMLGAVSSVRLRDPGFGVFDNSWVSGLTVALGMLVVLLRRPERLRWWRSLAKDIRVQPKQRWSLLRRLRRAGIHHPGRQGIRRWHHLLWRLPLHPVWSEHIGQRLRELDRITRRCRCRRGSVAYHKSCIFFSTWRY